MHQFNPKFKDLNLAVVKFEFDPTWTNFQSICNEVTPEMVRGAVNREKYGENSLISHDITQFALVYKGYKPMCLYEDGGLDILSIINSTKPCVSMYVISEDIRFNDDMTKYIKTKQCLIYQPKYKEKAQEFMTYLKNRTSASEEDVLHHYTMGNYLGYPKEDVDWFVYRGRI